MRPLGSRLIWVAGFGEYLAKMFKKISEAPGFCDRAEFVRNMQSKFENFL